MTKLDRRSVLRGGGLALLGSGWGKAQRTAECNCTRGTDGTPLDTGTSEMRPVIERYDVELRDLNRVYAVPGSGWRRSRLEKFYTEQLRLVENINFDALNQAGKIDYLLLHERLLDERKQLAGEARQEEEIAPLIPFQEAIIGLEEARRRMETIDPRKSAVALAKMTADIAAAKAALPNSKAAPAAMNRAAVRLSQLRNDFHAWFNFYDLYDPMFAWWVDAEYKRADEALEAHAQLLHTTSGVPGPLEAGPGGGFGGRGGGRGGRGETETAETAGRGGAGAGRGGAPAGSNEELSGIGPAGRDALVEALHAAMIAYTPDELIKLANREFAWCDREMLRASNEMGFGNDWKKAAGGREEQVRRAGPDDLPGARSLARGHRVRREARTGDDSAAGQGGLLGRGHDAADATGESVLHRRRHHSGLLAGQQP